MFLEFFFSSFPTGSLSPVWEPNQCKSNLIRLAERGFVPMSAVFSYRVHTDYSLLVEVLKKKGPDLQMLDSSYTLPL